jgi:DNA modification methylase
VLKLFKTPNDQKICYPFAGSGSEIIGGLQAGFSNWVACEINEEYIKIANARIKHYTTHEYVEVPLFDE